MEADRKIDARAKADSPQTEFGYYAVKKNRDEGGRITTVSRLSPTVCKIKIAR